MKVKIIVSYEIDNLIDDETLQLINVEKVKQYTDEELIEMVNEQFDYFKKFGDRHYSDTKDEQILEKYWDIITERVIEGLDIDESQVEEMDSRIVSLF